MASRNLHVTPREVPPELQLRVAATVAVVFVAFTLIGLFARGPYWNFYWPWEAWPAIPSRI